MSPEADIKHYCECYVTRKCRSSSKKNPEAFMKWIRIYWLDFGRWPQWKHILTQTWGTASLMRLGDLEALRRAMFICTVVYIFIYSYLLPLVWTQIPFSLLFYRLGMAVKKSRQGLSLGPWKHNRDMNNNIFKSTLKTITKMHTVKKNNVISVNFYLHPGTFNVLHGWEHPQEVYNIGLVLSSDGSTWWTHLYIGKGDT